MEKEFVFLPKKACPQCGQEVPFKEDLLPGILRGYCVPCKLLLQTSALPDGKVEVVRRKQLPEVGQNGSGV